MKSLCWFCCALSLPLVALESRAEAAETEKQGLAERVFTTDGAYGRLDGDMDLRLGAGVAVERVGLADAIAGVADFLGTAGR